MAKLGTGKNPIRVRVQNENRVEEVAALCTEHGWQFIMKIAPDEPEDISDIERKLNPPDPVKSSKIGRNAPCSCGSGKKYKKCCGL